jgi:hypothetical protein
VGFLQGSPPGCPFFLLVVCVLEIEGGKPIVKLREAALLRVQWAARSSPPCDHLNVEEVQFMDGRPPGDYACTVCRAEVKRPTKPTGDDSRVTGQTTV